MCCSITLAEEILLNPLTKRKTKEGGEWGQTTEKET